MVGQLETCVLCFKSFIQVCIDYFSKHFCCYKVCIVVVLMMCFILIIVVFCDWSCPKCPC